MSNEQRDWEREIESESREELIASVKHYQALALDQHDKITAEELQAYKAKAKRQRDNWKRRAVAYETAIRETLADNLHLADGNVCTLIKLKRVLSANAINEPVCVGNTEKTIKEYMSEPDESELDALKGAVRSAVQQCNDKDEDYAALERMYIQKRDEVERLRGLLNSCHKALESIADDRGMDDVAHILWSWAGGMTVDDVGYVIDSGQADGDKETTGHGE